MLESQEPGSNSGILGNSSWEKLDLFRLIFELC